ncbi:MAG: HIT family protein [Neisseriaceae bacterium]
MPSIFSRIIDGELPSYKVAENEDFIAILDINPNTKGHTLCIPKKEVDYIFSMPLEEYKALMAFSYQIACAIEKVVDCKRVGMSVVGLEVPHVHVHLIPLNEMCDISFKKKLPAKPEELTQLAEAIGREFRVNFSVF